MNELLERLAKWHEAQNQNHLHNSERSAYALGNKHPVVYAELDDARKHLATAAALRELIDKRDVSKDTLHQLPNIELEHSTDSLLTQAFPAMEDKR